jgi:hypothetical protein
MRHPGALALTGAGDKVSRPPVRGDIEKAAPAIDRTYPLSEVPAATDPEATERRVSPRRNGEWTNAR